MDKLIVLFLLTFSSTLLSGQTKFEKEVRIKEKVVPDKALGFIDSLGVHKKVRWYQETGLTKSSIEAKTTQQSKKMSIEFSIDGTFEDVEVQVKKNEIHPDTYTRINEYLTYTRNRYKIEKVQLQYSGRSHAVLNYLVNPKSLENITINYEVMIYTKVNKKYLLYEYLFSQQGDYIQHKEIVLKNTDHIEY